MNKITLIVFIFIIFSKLCLSQSTKDSVLTNHVLTPKGKIVPDTWKFDSELSRTRIIELDNILQSVYPNATNLLFKIQSL